MILIDCVWICMVSGYVVCTVKTVLIHVIYTKRCQIHTAIWLKLSIGSFIPLTASTFGKTARIEHPFICQLLPVVLARAHTINRNETCPAGRLWYLVDHQEAG